MTAPAAQRFQALIDHCDAMLLQMPELRRRYADDGELVTVWLELSGAIVRDAVELDLQGLNSAASIYVLHRCDDMLRSIGLVPVGRPPCLLRRPGHAPTLH